MYLNLGQLQPDLLRTRLLTPTYVPFLWSWLSLTIGPIQNQPVRPPLPLSATRSGEVDERLSRVEGRAVSSQSFPYSGS